MMTVSTGSVWTDLLLALVLVSYFVYWFFTKDYDYWEKRGVPNVKGGVFIDAMLGKRPQTEGIQELYKSFPDEKYFGMFQIKKPVLVLKDSNLINKIMVKDFTHFQDRGGPQNNNDPISKNLFNLRGNIWRAMRYKLTPTFTTGKLRGMFEQVTKCGDNMLRKIEEFSEKSSEVEVKSFLFEYTSEVISSCAFGLQFELGTRDFEIFKGTVNKMFRPNIKTLIKFVMFELFPKLAQFLDLRTFVQKEDGEYFLNLIKVTSKYRRENKVTRNDYLQLLMTLQDLEDKGVDMTLSVPDATEDDAVIDQMVHTGKVDLTANTKLFTDETLAANSVIFLIAGSESTSSTISHSLLELARHPEVQQKLQEEVDQVLAKHGQNWTYQTIKDMEYLDQVVQEVQRFYPIIPLLMRQCTKPYTVPDSELVIEKGILIAIPVIALHKDPQYYPDPEEFRPERFEGNNFKPNPAYLPYGDGPRICIAMRFAVMEVKTAIAKIMSQYLIKLSPKTKLPIKFNPKSFVPLVEGGVWLKFEKRKASSIQDH